MTYTIIKGRHVCYRLLGDETLPLMVLAHPLGMTQGVWDGLLPRLLERYRVLTWDLPGHGGSEAWSAGRPVTPDALADELCNLVALAGAERFHVIGTSIGGVVAARLLAREPQRLLSAVLTNTGAVIGSAELWQNRAQRVRSEGIGAVAADVVPRWFAPQTRAAQPGLEGGWCVQMARADDESYALLCEMLGCTDLRGTLMPQNGASVPVYLVGGSEDMATPPETLEALSGECGGAPLEILDAVAHVPAVECPEALAERIVRWLGPAAAPPDAAGVPYEQGLGVRRQMLGEEHVERATRGATPLDAPFQHLITRYAWGELWGNPDLPPRERSMITLGILAALGRDGELALHLDTAARLGVTVPQLRQVLMHVAIYAGVPAANHAFAMAKQRGWGGPDNDDD